MSGKSLLLKVLLLGDGGIGNSSLVNSYGTHKFDSQAFHTIGVEFLNQDLEVDGHLVTADLGPSGTGALQKPADALLPWCDYPYLETGVKVDTNVAVAFEEVVSQVLASEEQLEHSLLGQTVSLYPSAKPSSLCC